jgi:3-methyladenine DNA glycosylase AlkD
MVKVADELFRGEVLEEDGLAVEMLRKNIDDFGNDEFHLFESWIGRVGNWASHDSLVCYLVGPMIAAEPKRKSAAFRWAKSENRWYRRAACVALISGAREQLFFPDIVRLAELLLKDKDDMVQKGLGWLLRETVKYNREPAVPYLLEIRNRAPRLVLRTACETLPPAMKTEVLGSRTSSPKAARRAGASNTR